MDMQAMTRRATGCLGPEFYQRDATTVAREIIGCVLVRRYRGKVLRARIVEAEAYVGPHDLACHASKGRTARTETMFLPGGHAYVYFIYGMYEMLNIVTGKAEDPQAVLLRAAEGLDGLKADMSGPGKLTRALHISRALDGVELYGERLHLMPRAERDVPEIGVSARIGVDYAQHWRDEELRFFDRKSGAVSKRSETRRQTRLGD